MPTRTPVCLPEFPPLRFAITVIVLAAILVLHLGGLDGPGIATALGGAAALLAVALNGRRGR